MDQHSEAQIGRFLSRYPLHLVVLIGLVVAAAMGVWVGSGEFLKAGLIIAGAIAVGVTLALGRNYWLLIPFAFSTDLPAIPIQGRNVELGELAGATCALTFLARYALKLETFSLFRKNHAPFLLYAGWALMVFLLHPVGLSASGAGLGGARFYAKILIALIAFLVMANQEIRERQCQWIIIIILAGSVISELKDIGTYFLPFLNESHAVMISYEADAFYTWHQALATAPTAFIMVMLARYRSSEIFGLQRGVWLISLFLVCALFIVASGKRSALVAIPLAALTAALFRKEYVACFLWIGGSVLATTFLVVGHSAALFHLPLTAQRALSFLPGKWDSEMAMMEGGQDVFRVELRRLAIKKIRQDPWIGTGYQIDLKLAEDLTYQYMVSGGDIETQVTPFALSSSWHNTWLGYAADFGIPASFLVGAIYLTVFRRSWRMFRQTPAKSPANTLAMYLLLFTVRDMAISYQGGHSALDAYSRWWMYGLLVAIDLANQRRLAAPKDAKEPPDGRTLLQPALAGQPARQPLRVQRPSAF